MYSDAVHINCFIFSLPNSKSINIASLQTRFTIQNETPRVDTNRGKDSMAYDKELENEICRNALAQGLSFRDAMDMARRVMGIPGPPHGLYASMADQSSDALPHVESRGKGYTQLQPQLNGYFDHPCDSDSRVDPGDKYEDRGAYNVLEVRPARSLHGSHAKHSEYVCAGQSSKYSEREVCPGGSFHASYGTSDRYGYEERFSSSYDACEKHHSNYFNGRYSTTHLPRPEHSTSISHAVDLGRRYNIREAVPNGSTRNPYPEFPRTQTCGGDDYFIRAPSSSHYEPGREASSAYRRIYNYPRGNGTYNTRTAVPDGMPHPSPPPNGTFPPPPPLSQHGRGTRNVTPDTPRPALVPKASMMELYAILGVPRTATTDELKKAYRKLSLQYHPDRAQDNKEQATVMMAKINQAYDVLKDETCREKYDKTGEL
jgi:hypothetical protein